ncbi:MAG TPA: NUDIX hydrolase [Ktedonobacteraceae bacterium]|nr:NUDIX hydrolase [Ktedonobacteraceae bacterium]
MVQQRFYLFLGWLAGLCFNVLNFFIRGNLPPFGSVCLVVRNGEHYLCLEHLEDGLALPGGFMRWRETPQEAGRRECEEETGMQVRMLYMVDCISSPGKSFADMSTLTMVYSAEVVGGTLRPALEGRPGWFTEAEARRRLRPRYRPFFESYLRSTHQQATPASSLPSE